MPVEDRKPAITSALPKTDPGMRIPVSDLFGELVATPTVLPEAVMPAPSLASETTSPLDLPQLALQLTSTLPATMSASNLPQSSTPLPGPAFFALEGEVNGQVLKRLRQARGLSLEAMVEASKIRKPYLIAIEEQDFENLPARVYLRGFLMTIGRVLKVDKAKLAEGYLAFVARYGK